jgi:ferredoxin
VDVRLMALESEDELPASDLEIEETVEEGVQVHTRLGPNKILGLDGRVVGLETIDVESLFDAEGRFALKFRPGTEKRWECDTVILAIGQAPDLALLGGADDIQVGPRGFVVTDPETGRTSAPDIFAGGDVAHGPRLLIHAVRDGHLAALTIDARLQGRPIERRETVSWSEIPGHKMPDGWLAYSRERVPSLPVDRRTGHTQVEVGYSAGEGAVQGLRCLECSINTVFHGEKCILCNGCVDVCPWSCLKIVDLAQIRGDETLWRVVEHHAGGPLETEAAGALAAMIKDDTACTRCALCAERCPTDAITMESFRFREELAYGPERSQPTRK